MRKDHPELVKASFRRTPCPTPSRSPRRKGEDIEGDRGELRSCSGRGREGNYAAKTASRVLKAARVIKGSCPPRRRDPPRRVGDVDREHDPALDLRAAARDRGDEARRSLELVHPRPVHPRGDRLRRHRLAAGGDPARRWARSSPCRRSSRTSTPEQACTPGRSRSWRSSCSCSDSYSAQPAPPSR